jgi:uncharacterized protein YggU (UPF0235/DUF167 family)
MDLPNGTYIKATVRAAARNDTVTMRGDRYLITTKAQARGGLANESARALLAQHLSVRPQRLSLVRGSQKPTKLFLLRGRALS